MDNYTYNMSSYPESGNSSPRSREIEFENPPPWEDSQSNPPPNYKVKLMCSYGGKIHPRPHDNLLSYVGGETKILAVDRNIKFASLLSKLVAMCDGDSISFKYQLPGEDLDALISVTSDDDLEHMMNEYDRLYRISPKPARLRIFAFPSLSKSPSLNSPARSFGSEEGRSEKERFVEALNSAPILSAPPQPVVVPAVVTQQQPPAGNADFLFGLEKGNAVAPPQPVAVGRSVQEMEDPVMVPGLDERLAGLDPIQKHIQDLQRLRLEDQQQQQHQQQQNYRRKSDDNLSGGFTGGEFYRVPEKIQPVAVHGGVPYWAEKQVPGGVYPATTVNNNNEQQIYMVPTSGGAYHAPVRQLSGAPPQGYYAVQRVPSAEMYRDQQQQMYNHVISTSSVQSAMTQPSPPPQKVAGYSEGYGIMRPGSTGGLVTEAGYAQMAYDGGMGRQVFYSAPGGVMGTPAPNQAAAAAAQPQYQAIPATYGGDMRGLNQEAGGKIGGKPSQTSM